MKKIYLLLLLFAATYSNLSAQVVLKEGFETGAFPPVGWTLINAGNGNSWRRNDDNIFFDLNIPAYKGTKCMVYKYNNQNKANAWMISPALNLTQGQSYGISFYYRILDDRYPEKLKVTIGDAATVPAQTTILWSNNGQDSLTNTNYLKGITQFIPGSSGNYFVGFNCFSEADKYFLLVDSIVVQTAPSTPPGCASNISPANNATAVNRPTANLQWSAVTGAIGYQLYFGTVSPAVEYGPFDIASNSTDIFNLDYNTTYQWYVVPYNNAGYATGCKTNNLFKFTTIPLPQKPPCTTNLSPANNATNVSFPSANFSVTGLANATGYDLYMNDGVLIFIESKDSPNFTFDRLTANTQYIWYVVPKNDGGKAGNCNSTAFKFTTGGTLPVVWLSFKAAKINGQNMLQWATASETNNSYFLIERSVDGRIFNALGKVSSTAHNGNATQKLEYTFTDSKPITGNNWYRLKQVDKDGNATYSSVVVVQDNAIDQLRLVSIYPNPVKNIMYGNLTSTHIQTLQIVITDVLGRTIKTLTTQVQNGDNTLQIPMAQLRGGIYMLRIAGTDGKTITQKIIKD